MTVSLSVLLLAVTVACSGTTAGTAAVGTPSTAALAPTPSVPAVAVVEVTRTVAPPAAVTSVVTTTAEPPPAPVVVTHTEVATVTAAAGGGGGGTRRTVSGLVSPSGNITCGVVGGILFCTIGVYDFDLPSCPSPSSGALISLASTGPSDISSCGAEILDGVDATTLEYGDVAALGSYVCTVEEVGMACVSPGGFGFTIARAGYQPF
ncbi:hypothetical protein FDO65_04995 [Nakamurella flava]|uniref:Uncharacterized protein n=1 Tax=Nakamurella flava TaxID=2576308 RepID=A0A4U6QL36_9ACTN|nr:hypothetical protein [Nakamurella flava]TKV61009.1 hypothetical protein FDO65_04995 [Nakamurella flava]